MSNSPWSLEHITTRAHICEHKYVNICDSSDGVYRHEVRNRIEPNHMTAMAHTSYPIMCATNQIHLIQRSHMTRHWISKLITLFNRTSQRPAYKHQTHIHTLTNWSTRACCVQTYDYKTRERDRIEFLFIASSLELGIRSRPRMLMAVCYRWRSCTRARTHFQNSFYHYQYSPPHTYTRARKPKHIHTHIQTSTTTINDKHDREAARHTRSINTNERTIDATRTRMCAVHTDTHTRMCDANAKLQLT